ncbi:MAG: hypothetical protein MI920_37010 [Kiloniellales bacterium]|nr:hypothetical protein [Kiloniellales bacterium]
MPRVSARRLGLVGVLAGALLVGGGSAWGQTSNVDLDVDTDIDTDVSVDNDVSVDISKALDVSQDIDVSGNVTISGDIAIAQSVMALVDNNQVVNDSVVSLTISGAELSNMIVLGTDVLQTSSGNIGVNLSSGASILQENSATLSSQAVAGNDASADSGVFSLQQSLNNNFTVSGNNADVVNSAQLLGNVLSDASGNVGVNLAIGAFHLQKNSLALAAATGDTALSQATAAVVQEISFTQTFHIDTSNSVTLGDNVLAGASGNIGLNITAGTNNIQQNTLVLSSGQ